MFLPSFRLGGYQKRGILLHHRLEDNNLNIPSDQLRQQGASDGSLEFNNRHPSRQGHQLVDHRQGTRACDVTVVGDQAMCVVTVPLKVTCVAHVVSKGTSVQCVGIRETRAGPQPVRVSSGS